MWTEYNIDNMHTHPTVHKIQKVLDLSYSCGIIRMQKVEGKKKSIAAEWVPCDLYPPRYKNQASFCSLNSNRFFGVPIFNRKLNQQILDKIEKRQLFSEENMKKHSKSSRFLSLRLLDFIAQFRPPADVQITPHNIDLPYDNVCLPCKRVTFCGGVLSSEWKKKKH